MATYADVPMDLADASIVELAERTGLRRVFTVDHHFRIYRANRTEVFELVP
jgi:predicted nucleic acid-binding protein